jgi:phosphoadenosine phosphosulfate reductase
MGLEQLHLEGINKVQFSIELIQSVTPKQGKFYLTDSGGKDSRALRKLAELAKVPFESHYHANPLDPPEVPKFLKENYPDVIFDRAPIPFWKAFASKGFPLRSTRWCCQYIKEWGGAGQTVLLGLRSQESPKRKSKCFITWNEKGRTRFTKKTTRNVICPMLLWTKKDVWTFLEQYQVPYLSLYDEGATGKYKGDGNIQRVGCVMCPCATDAERLTEYYRYPKIALNWQLAFKRLWNDGRPKDPDTYKKQFATPDDMFWWWMAPPRDKNKAKSIKMEGL